MADASGYPALGTALKDRRRAMGMTQEQLAEQLGVHKMTVVKYESGQVPLSLERLNDIAVILRTSLIGLLLQAGYKLEMPAGYEYDGEYVVPDFIVRDPATQQGMILEIKGRDRTSKELAALRKSAAEQGLPIAVVDEEAVPKQTPRPARNIPLSVRQYIAEFQLRLTTAGVSELETDDAIALLRSSVLLDYFKGDEAGYADAVRSLGEQVLVPHLRGHGYEVPGVSMNATAAQSAPGDMSGVPVMPTESFTPAPRPSSAKGEKKKRA